MENKRSKFVEIIGWYGVVALLAAYMLLSLDIIGSKDIWYQFLNMTGAVAIVVDALHQKNWQPAVLNIIWGIIALVAIIKILL